MISGRSLSAAWCRQVYPWPEYTFTSAPLLIRYLASSSQHTTNISQVSLLLDELRVVPEHGVVEAGAVAAALVEDIDIRPLLHEQPGHLHTPVLPHTGHTAPGHLHVPLGQGVVQGREGGVVSGTADVSSRVLNIYFQTYFELFILFPGRSLHHIYKLSPSSG